MSHEANDSALEARRQDDDNKSGQKTHDTNSSEAVRANSIPPDDEDPEKEPNRKYEDAPYHGAKGNTEKSRKPTIGQKALDGSLQVKDNSRRRIGVDPTQDESVISDEMNSAVTFGNGVIFLKENK